MEAEQSCMLAVLSELMDSDMCKYSIDVTGDACWMKTNPI